MRFDMIVNSKDVKRYIFSLASDAEIVGVTKNNEECLLARTARMKYGDGVLVRVHNTNELISFGNERIVVTEIAKDIADRFDRLFDFMTSITRGQLYARMEDLKMEVNLD